jgi:uncharacterized protein (DUF488 family)
VTESPAVYTIGHSTRSLDEVLALLEEHEVTLLVDVRRFPFSRRHPQFNRESMASATAARGIAYRHEERLGGRRPAQPDSPNTGWRNAGFRGYADHAMSPPFAAAIEVLMVDASERRVCVMCAEAVPWRCHRQLIADRLVAGGTRVVHILGPGKTQSHQLREWVRRLSNGVLVYPDPVTDGQGELF